MLSYRAHTRSSGADWGFCQRPRYPSENNGGSLMRSAMSDPRAFGVEALRRGLLAPEALWDAARLYERGGGAASAEELFGVELALALAQDATDSTLTEEAPS